MLSLCGDFGGKSAFEGKGVLRVRREFRGKSAFNVEERGLLNPWG